MHNNTKSAFVIERGKPGVIMERDTRTGYFTSYRRPGSTREKA
jgi:hypothetical protein